MPRAGKTRAPLSILGESRRCNTELCPPARMELLNLCLLSFRSVRGIHFTDRMNRIRVTNTVTIIAVTLLLLHPGEYIPRRQKVRSPKSLSSLISLRWGNSKKRKRKKAAFNASSWMTKQFFVRRRKRSKRVLLHGVATLATYSVGMS